MATSNRPLKGSNLDRLYWVPSSSGTENGAKLFSFLNTRSHFLTVLVVPALLATPSAALGDLASSASVAARPTRGDDVLEDHGGPILCPLETRVERSRYAESMNGGRER
jgi:hypothetical protein